MELYPKAMNGGKFMIDAAIRFKRNAFMPRRGTWSTPWPYRIVPEFAMPKYDPNFKVSFAEVSDSRAADIRTSISDGNRILVYYSGGIDSTIVLAALIRNLSDLELKQVSVCLNGDSIIENPNFYKKFIKGKMNVLDSAKHKYNESLRNGYRPINGDTGDAIFGTEVGIQLYYNMGINSFANKELHFSKFADGIIDHFNIGMGHNPDFGRLLYQKLVMNIETSDVPIHTLHDFFWWIIFCTRYMHCALRSSTIYNTETGSLEWSIREGIINWFNHENYQLWSMNNNNVGEKIGNSLSTYKMAGRRYIYELDKNEWYFKYKFKLSSLRNIIPLSLGKNNVFGLDQDYRLHRTYDLKEYITETINKYEIDW